MAKTKEIHAICDQIEAQLVELAKGAREDLTKVHPGEETVSESPADVSASAPGPAAPPPAPEASAPPAPDADAAPGEPGPEGAEAAPTHEEMVQALQSLPPEQLEAWRAALDEVMAAAGGGDAPPAPEASAPPPGPGPEDAMKAEIARFGEVLNKAEAGLKVKDQEIDAVKAQLKAATEQLAKQEKDLKEAAETVQSWVRQPQRRGQIALPVSAATADPLEGLTKAEIIPFLRTAARTRISDAERKEIDTYCFSGQATDTIRKLVAAAKTS